MSSVSREVRLFAAGLGCGGAGCVYFLAAGAIIAQRRDLLWPALITALIMMPIFIVVYILVFHLGAPEFWDKYWDLKPTRWGVTIFGDVPLTELLWYFTWGLLGSVSYPFISGRRLMGTDDDSATTLLESGR